MHSLIVWTAVIVVAASIPIKIGYDARRYPMCPRCPGNLSSKRIRFFGKVAVCSKHGEFTPKDGKSFRGICSPINRTSPGEKT